MAVIEVEIKGEESMAQASVIDVAALVESRKIGRVQIGIWALAFLMVFVDGFDFSGPLAGKSMLQAFGRRSLRLDPVQKEFWK